MPYESWAGKKCKIEEMHTFGCLVQYLKVGHDKDKKSAKYASKTSYGVFLGVAVGQAGFLIFDPTRVEVVVRTDVKFHESIPGYPRFIGRNAMPVNHQRDSDFFTLFPSDEPTEEPASIPTVTHVQAHLPNQPAILPPFDVIQLSSDSESRVNLGTGIDADGGDDANGGLGAESIADRVAARYRALFGSVQETL